MWGFRSRAPMVDVSVVDRLEESLRSKLETLSGFREEPNVWLKQLFTSVDRDGSGKVNRDEFIRTLEQMNFVGYKNEMQSLFSRYDLDRSGYVDYREFSQALCQVAQFKSVSLIGRIRHALTVRAGGYLSLKDLGRQFQFIDKNGSGSLDKFEIKRGMEIFLNGFGIRLRPVEYDALFDRFDYNKDGVVNYSEFIRTLRGDMNDRRVSLVKMAFKVLDKDGSGVVTLDEIAAAYNVSQHPKVKSGEISPGAALKEFMGNWDKDKDEKVTESEFIEYYEWISPSIDDDDYFELMIRNAWHISGGTGWAQNTSCRRVLVTHTDGRQTVEEIQNDIGIGPRDTDKMCEYLKRQGINAAKIELYN